MKNKLQKLWNEVGKPLFQRPERVQFAALCTRRTETGEDVLLITSRETKRWVIPKGWPIDGLDGAETALQEAWEEAGVRATSFDKTPIGHFTYDKILKDGTSQAVRTNVYRIPVTELSDQYPEAHERQRCWVSPKVAAERVNEPELRDLLLHL